MMSQHPHIYNLHKILFVLLILKAIKSLYSTNYSQIIVHAVLFTTVKGSLNSDQSNDEKSDPTVYIARFWIISKSSATVRGIFPSDVSVAS
jgi:hypothetical protein